MITYKNATKAVATNEGGIANEISPLAAARRFVVLGTKDGSFYASEKQLTYDNVGVIQVALKHDPVALIDMIADVSKRGLAPSNDPAIVALAVTQTHPNVNVRNYALNKLKDVCRTGTHLFTFCMFVDDLRGWGVSLRRALSDWYLSQKPEALAYGVTKYASRTVGNETWTHKDVLRLAHPKTNDEEINRIFKYITKGEVPAQPFETFPPTSGKASLDYLVAVDQIKHATPSEAIDLIMRYNLPREVLPTELLNNADVWLAMLPKMPLMATLRNLATMTRVGVLGETSQGEREVLTKLTNRGIISASKIHPFDVLKAKMTYAAGRGVRGQHEWTPNRLIVAALEETFNASFENVIPSNKRIMVCLDVSSSMKYPTTLGGVPNLDPRTAAALLALTSVKSEPYTYTYAFSTDFIPFDLTANDTVDTVRQRMADTKYGNTYAHLPIQYATEHQLDIDAFVIYTDAETWGPNPSDYLRNYRAKMNKPEAKLINVAMVANRISTADPSDVNMLDVVGMDSSVPSVISHFIAGRV